MEYRIIIAEDEEIERTALRLILHTRMPQFRVIAETNNGVELLELCRQENPDIVLLDINMPGINGLDAMEQIRQSVPDIHFIILSAYADFGYAQRALKLGACDYLTKPIKTDLLIAALMQAAEEMQSAAHDTEDRFQMTKKVEIVWQQMEYNIMRAFLTGQITEDIKVQFSILFKAGSQYLCILAKPQEAADNKFHSPELYKLLREKLLMFSDNLIVQDTGVLHFILLSVDASKLTSNIYQYCYELRSFLGTLYKKQGVASMQIYMGQAVSDLEELAEEYKSLSKKCIQYQRKSSAVRTSGFGRLLSMEEALLDSVMRGNSSAGLKLADDICSILKDKSSGDLKMFREYLRDSFSMIRRGLSAKTVNPSYIQTMYEEFFFFIQDAPDIDTMRKGFQNFIISCCEYVNLQEEEEHPDIDMESLLQYVRQNYTKDISLDQIADQHKISASYLSKLIKNYLGKNYIDYITDLRIGRAKELLTDTNKTIQEIACEVGYNSQTYFCKVFKRAVGISAGEYKKWK